MATTARGIILDIRPSALVVTVMPPDAPPYRARVVIPVGADATTWRVGSHVELRIGDDPADVRLPVGGREGPGRDPGTTDDRPPAA
jgi:hypothetical protein